MSNFVFPDRRETPIIETALMREVSDRTTAIHNASPIVVWSGHSRLGKTTTATWLTEEINEAFTVADPAAFKAEHYQATDLGVWPTVNKTAMAAFHAGVLGPLDEGLYRRRQAHDLAALIVRGLKRSRIEVVFVDEAGLYSLPAIRGLVAIRDQAVKVNHRLTLVLIGMDDLPIKLNANPQIKGRIHEWCFFEPYERSETADLVREISDLWSGPSLSDAEKKRQLGTIHELTGGVPGRIVAFVGKVERELKQADRELTNSFIKAIHLRTLKDMQRAKKAALDGFSRYGRSDTDDQGAA